MGIGKKNPSKPLSIGVLSIENGGLKMKKKLLSSLEYLFRLKKPFEVVVGFVLMLLASTLYVATSNIDVSGGFQVIVKVFIMFMYLCLFAFLLKGSEGVYIFLKVALLYGVVTNDTSFFPFLGYLAMVSTIISICLDIKNSLMIKTFKRKNERFI